MVPFCGIFIILNIHMRRFVDKNAREEKARYFCAQEEKQTNCSVGAAAHRLQHMKNLKAWR